MERRGVAGYGLVAAGSVAWLAVPAALMAGPVRLEPLIGSGPFLVLFATGVTAWWLRPTHPGAWRLLLAGSLVSLGISLSALLDAAGEFRESPTGWAVAVAATFAADLALAALLDLFCAFPDGRYPVPWVRMLSRLGYIVAALSALLTVLRPYPPLPISALDPHATTRTPFVGPLVEQLAHWPVLDPYLFMFLPVALATMVLRYRSAGAEVRAQLRWPMTGVGVLAVVVLMSWTGLLDPVLPDIAAQLLFAASVSAIPVGLFVGIVRHRLFDLDRALRRSASYAVLWVLIAAAYAAIAAVPGVAAGDRVPPTVAVLLTIAAAMAFQPARRKLERLADRLVFGHRIGGYALIQRFGTALESAVPAAELAPRLAATTQQGLDAGWARVWVLSTDGTRADLAGAAGEVTTAPDLGTDLSAAGEALGRLECGPRRRGHHTPADLDLLRTLGRQAALALSNARLTDRLGERLAQLDAQAHELAASRTRIVTAEAAGRRQLERDIHDGIQQQLVSLMTKLSVARAQLAAQPDSTAATLDVMQAEFRQVVADLRDLASGIHPAVLTDQGLVPAVEALAARLPLPVSIDYPNGTATGRLDPQVEAAAYFGIAEALTNILKHAGAHHAWVRLSRDNGSLAVEISDDGHGFDTTATRQRGLAGLRDRLEALDGSLAVTSGPPGPTTVRMQLPSGLHHHG